VPKAEYAKTIPELAQKTGESESTIKRHKKSPKFPIKGKRGWNVEKVVSFIQNRRAKLQADSKTTNVLDQIKAERAQVETELSRHRLQSLKGELISIEDHEQDIADLLQFLVNGLDQFVQEVAALTKSGQLVKIAKKARDRTRAKLSEKALKIAAGEKNGPR
jgi:phage-related protein